MVHARAAVDVEVGIRWPAEESSGHHLAVGDELEAFGKAGAQADDAEVAKVYEKAGAKVVPLDIETVGKWANIARDTAWKDYAAKTKTSANLLKLATDVAA